MKTKRKLPKFIDINTFDFIPYGPTSQQQNQPLKTTSSYTNSGKGVKASVGLHISTVSGEIGIQGDDWKFTVGGALGLGVSGGFDINVPEKRLALDLTAIYGISFAIDLPDSGF